MSPKSGAYLFISLRSGAYNSSCLSFHAICGEDTPDLHNYPVRHILSPPGTGILQLGCLHNTVRKRRRPTQAETQVSCDEGNVESGEKEFAFEDHVDDRDKEEGTSGENKIGGGDSGEDDEGDGEKDAIDELEYIVEA
eukprot:scaffold4457_cov142-Skeletonema_marinoi.AAC.3